METVLRNKSFEIQFTLQYDDTSTAINLNDVNEITILIRHQQTKETLLTGTYTGGSVEIITAASGICSIYVNDSDTTSARLGNYEYVVTVNVTNTDFDSNEANHANFGNAFILAK